MFLGCMGSTTGFKPIPTPSIQGPLVFGMTVASIIQVSFREKKNPFPSTGCEKKKKKKII